MIVTTYPTFRNAISPYVLYGALRPSSVGSPIAKFSITNQRNKSLENTVTTDKNLFYIHSPFSRLASRVSLKVANHHENFNYSRTMTITTRSRASSKQEQPDKRPKKDSKKKVESLNLKKTKPRASIQKKVSKKDSTTTTTKNKPKIHSSIPEIRTTDGTCFWCLSAPDYLAYHDEEWGTPLYDDKKVFEFLLLETFQAGLSWSLILRKRNNFSAAFHDYDVDKVAAMTEKDVEILMTDTGIVRNRMKINAAITNAQTVISMREKEGLGLAEYFWRWVDFKPVVNMENKLITKTDLSDRISKDLKNRGFKFVGSTVIYSHLQATGIVNDHYTSCPKYVQVGKLLKTEEELKSR